MTKNPLHQFTQFYKGETQPPANCPHPNLWYYEQMWVENEEERDENHGRVREYIHDVLPLYHEDDGIPLTLKALLYNRYTHWVGGYSLENDVKGFVQFLHQQYLGKRKKDDDVPSAYLNKSLFILLQHKPPRHLPP